jgi:hypothetical protein
MTTKLTDAQVKGIAQATKKAEQYDTPAHREALVGLLKAQGLTLADLPTKVYAECFDTPERFYPGGTFTDHSDPRVRRVVGLARVARMPHFAIGTILNLHCPKFSLVADAAYKRDLAAEAAKVPAEAPAA